MHQQFPRPAVNGQWTLIEHLSGLSTLNSGHTFNLSHAHSDTDGRGHRARKHSAVHTHRKLFRVSVSSICIQQTNPPINGRPALPPEPPLRRGHDLLDHLIACFLIAAGQSEAHLCSLAAMPPGWLVAAQDDPSHPSVLLSASFLLLLWSFNGRSRYNSAPFQLWVCSEMRAEWRMGDELGQLTGEQLASAIAATLMSCPGGDWNLDAAEGMCVSKAPLWTGAKTQRKNSTTELKTTSASVMD